MTFDPYNSLAQEDLEKLQTSQSLTHELEILVGEVFGNEPGLKLLGYLEAITINRPSFVVGQEATYGYFREGQNDLVRQIIQLLEKKDPQLKSKIHLLFKSWFKGLRKTV